MAGRRQFEALTDEAVTAIAALFGIQPTAEPYSPDGETVWRLTLEGAADGVTLILWPSLARIDVSSTGNHAWVLKAIERIEIIDGVEVVFHPVGVRGFLFVSVNGWVNMVIG